MEISSVSLDNKCNCPYCNFGPLNHASTFAENGNTKIMPVNGDYTLCIFCGGLCVYNQKEGEPLTITKITTEQETKLIKEDPFLWLQIRMSVAAIQKNKTGKKYVERN